MALRKAAVAALILMPPLSVQAAPPSVLRNSRLAGITLGMPRTDVWKHVGKPTEIRLLKHAGRSYSWDNWQDDRRRETVISRQGRVVQVEHRVISSDRSGEGFLSIREQHPHLRASLYHLREETGSVLLVDDARQGVGWVLYIHHEEGFGMHLLNGDGPSMVITHRPGWAVLPDAAETLDEHDPLIKDIRTWFVAKPQKHEEAKETADGKSL